jgi:hypothetical protein
MRSSRFPGRGGVALVTAVGFLLAAAVLCNRAFADVSPGSKAEAEQYYRQLADTIGFSTPAKIFDTTLDDVATYLGYDGLTGADMQNLPSDVLMDPDKLLAPNVLKNRDRLIAALHGGKLGPDDILVSRFFAPKIVNIDTSPATRQLGWRKMVRLKA